MPTQQLHLVYCIPHPKQVVLCRYAKDSMYHLERVTLLGELPCSLHVYLFVPYICPAQRASERGGRQTLLF